MSKNNYSGKSVKVLHGLEAIRERFDVYIGSKSSGVQHLVKEAIDNSVDEFLNGYATYVKVEVNTKENIIKISDNGRGMPIDMHPEEKKPTLEVLFTSIHAGGKFNDKTAFKVSSGRNGIGIKAISALSEFLNVKSYTSTDFYGAETGIGKMSFSKGEITSPFKKFSNKDNNHGTIIEFKPDVEIFEEYSDLNPELIRENLEQRTYSNAGLKAILVVDGKISKFQHKNGLEDYLEMVSSDFNDISEPFKYSFNNDENEYEIIFKYANTDTENFYSFVNGIKVGGGTQEAGFKMSLTNAFNKFINDNKLLPKDIKDINPDDIRKGLFCIINIKHTNPDFKSQTKDELTNPEVKGVVMKETNQSLIEWIDKNNKTVRNIANRIIKFAKARINTEKYIQKNIIKVSSTGVEHSKKFIDCATTDPDKKRIYIAEGDSAMNNLIYCRDPEYMAVYGLKGKPLNIYGMNFKNIMQNAEMNGLALALFNTNDIKIISNIENILTKNIIIASDADIDGEHIRSLMINNLWEINPDIIKCGYVYICLTPKYRTIINGKNVFFQDDNELANYRYEMIKKNIKSKDINIKNLLKIQNDFLRDVQKIITKYSIHEEVFDTMLGAYDSFSILSDLFEFDKNTGRFQGFYENYWHNFNYKNLLLEIEQLRNFYFIPLSFNCIINGNEEEFTVFGLLNYINENYKLKLFYLKGLGENSPEEFKEFMNPSTERLIQIKCDSVEEIEKKLEIFFGNKTTLRKEFVLNELGTK